MSAKKARDYTFNELSSVVTYIPPTGEFVDKASGAILRGRTYAKGYVLLHILGVQFLAHRLAWMLMTGDWPCEQVDHINRVRTDNRWRNLRAATPAQNSQNSINPAKRDLPVGVKRAHNSRRNPFSAAISVNNKSRGLGAFPTAELAHSAYLEARKKLHGEFSPFHRGQP